MYIQKREREGHTKQNKGFFLISKDLIMNMDKFQVSSFKFNKCWHIQSFPIIRFDICLS